MVNGTQWTLALVLGALGNAAYARGQPPFVAPGFAIPDNNPAGISSSVQVGAIDGLIDTLVIRLDWPSTVAEGGHPWVGDLAATITFTPDAGGPSITCDLFRRIGASSAGSLGDSSDLRWFYQFSNYIGPFPPRNIWEQAASVGFNAPVPGGPYPPSTRDAAFQYQPLNFVSVFGLSVGPGTWTLNISDHNPGNTGRLVQWSIEYFIPAPGTATLFTTLAIATLCRRRR